MGQREDDQKDLVIRILNIPYGLLINFQTPSTDTEKETQLEIREIKI